HGLLARAWRRRGRPSQELREDLLGALIKAPAPCVTARVEKLADRFPGYLVRWGLRRLRGEGLVERSAGQWQLTDIGTRAATRVRRAHRLWETYLQRIGVPADELHSRADDLEHVNDAEALAYIDDLLGHPERDPHGKPIPSRLCVEDFDHPLPLSWLRADHDGEVVAVGTPARALGLVPGMPVTVGPRADDGSWTLLTSNGAVIHVAHDQADAILVELAGD
ncbi:MAG: metal-dependent transcriptional regulator, partial [Planctomycetota bacterium]